MEEHLIVKVIKADDCFIHETIEFKIKVDHLEDVKYILEILEKAS